MQTRSMVAAQSQKVIQFKLRQAFQKLKIVQLSIYDRWRMDGEISGRL